MDLEKMEFSGDPYSPRNGQLNAVRVGGAMSFQWPADSITLQSRVSINFNASLDDIATQLPGEFDAIKPIGPFFEYRDYGVVQSLQEKLRTVLEAR
jgi:hypothetical protein